MTEEEWAPTVSEPYTLGMAGLGIERLLESVEVESLNAIWRRRGVDRERVDATLDRGVTVSMNDRS